VSLLAAVTTLYFSMNRGEGANLSASGETTRALLSPVYMGPENPEDAEPPYDELSKGFIGVPVSNNEAINGLQTYVLPEVYEEDVNERVYDELRIRYTGIPAPRSEATNRLLPVGED
jgi:hypothetical protein